MALIDMQKWRSFCVGELFACDTTLNIPSKNDLTDGDINYITRSAVDNGLSGFCGNTESLNKGQCITIGAEGFVAFWQPDDFVAGNKVYTLRHKDLNEVRALFVCAALNVLSKDYSFANARVLDKIKKEVISLPATPDGQPDWAYMDAYMGEVLKKEEVFAEHLASLTAEAVVDGHPLDTSSWKVFRIGELFEIRPTKAYKLTNSDLLNVNGNIPVVANSAQNNGVVGFSNLEATEKGGIITFSDTTDANAIFYQSHDFIGYAHVQGMYRKFEKVSDVVMLFLATAFQSQALKMNFDYANKFRRDIALNIEISLPVTADGMPDWTWMEQYMQRQMDKAAALVEHLDAVWN